MRMRTPCGGIPLVTWLPSGCTSPRLRKSRTGHSLESKVLVSVSRITSLTNHQSCCSVQIDMYIYQTFFIFQQKEVTFVFHLVLFPITVSRYTVALVYVAMCPHC